MSLQNLLGISLEQITPQKETVRRLLDGATIAWLKRHKPNLL
jgi:hypothetical protein